jgi:hypothetical protein
MDKKFVTYLESVGMTDILIKKAAAMHKVYCELCAEKITDIFVSEHLNEDGSRVYDSLWFFSENYFMESSEFTYKGNYDIAPMRKKITLCRVETQEYDFSGTTDKSRMFVKAQMELYVNCEFKASKNNCDHLRAILKKYISPNLKEG